MATRTDIHHVFNEIVHAFEKRKEKLLEYCSRFEKEAGFGIRKYFLIILKEQELLNRKQRIESSFSFDSVSISDESRICDISGLFGIDIALDCPHEFGDVVNSFGNLTQKLSGTILGYNPISFPTSSGTHSFRFYYV